MRISFSRFVSFPIVLLLLLNLLACSTSINDYQQQQPNMKLFEYFEGKTKAYGMVQDYRGKQIRRFEVNIIGTLLSEKELRLDEDFIYDDGEKQTRVWIISKTADGEYEGRADDVIGVARGKEMGNALQWQYVLRVKTKQGEIDLQLNDWMFRQDDKRVFNVAKMKKLGIELGEITLFFEKVSE